MSNIYKLVIVLIILIIVSAIDSALNLWDSYEYSKIENCYKIIETECGGKK